MTLPIIWRLNARSDLAEIIRYVANVNPQAARRLRQVLMESVLPVSEHPYFDHPAAQRLNQSACVVPAPPAAP